MLPLKWIIYGEFNDHRSHVSVLEEVPRVRQDRTLQQPAVMAHFPIFNQTTRGELDE